MSVWTFATFQVLGGYRSGQGRSRHSPLHATGVHATEVMFAEIGSYKEKQN